MRITAGRREDILRDKAKYDAEAGRRKAISDEADSRYGEAQYARENEVENYLKSNLAKFDLLQFNIQVDFYYNGSGRVVIHCDQDRKFDDNVPLAWTYRADCKWGDSDTVTRETSSWSGLNATKPEHIASLKQSVDAIEFLNSVDWEGLLIHTGPRGVDYRTDFEPDEEFDSLAKRDFDAELIELDLEEAAGTDTWFKYHGGTHGGDGWIRIDKVSPATYSVSELSDRQVVSLLQMSPDEFEKYKNWYATPRRIKKSDLISKLFKPLERKEL